MNDEIVFVLNRGIKTVTSTQLLMMAKCIIDEEVAYDNKIIFILPSVKSKRLVPHIEKIIGHKIDKVYASCKEYDEHLYRTNNYETWKDFYRQEDWFGDLRNAKEIFILGGILSGASNIKRAKPEYVNRYLNCHTYMSFNAVGKYLASNLQVLKLSNDNYIPIHEICYDPEEFSYDLITDPVIKPHNHNLYFFYDIPRYNMLKHSMLMNTFKRNTDLNRKRNMFCFGASFVTKGRYEFYDKLSPMLTKICEKHSENNIRLFIKNKEKGINDSMPYDEYLNHIAASNFTLIIPAYDQTTFSLIRFYEAIANGCIPLIHEGVDLSEFLSSYKLDKFYTNILTVNNDNVVEKMYEIMPMRKKLIEYFLDRI